MLIIGLINDRLLKKRQTNMSCLESRSIQTTRVARGELQTNKID